MDLSSLIKSQQELFDQLKKAERNLKKSNQEMRSKFSFLSSRMEALDKLEEIFNQTHLKIVARATTEQIETSPYFTEDMQDIFQETFLQYKALLKQGPEPLTL